MVFNVCCFRFLAFFPVNFSLFLVLTNLGYCSHAVGDFSAKKRGNPPPPRSRCFSVQNVLLGEWSDCPERSVYSRLVRRHCRNEPYTRSSCCSRGCSGLRYRVPGPSLISDFQLELCADELVVGGGVGWSYDRRRRRQRRQTG